MAHLFGTDGVRGQANVSLIPELAFDIGRAHGFFIRNGRSVSAGDNVGSERPVIAVGRDTRISGQMLQYSYVCGLNSSGVDALLLGVLPTPGIAWAIRNYGADGGCVISASHNPFYDNGIKLIGGNGYKLTDDEEHRLEELIKDASSLPRASKDGLGIMRFLKEAGAAYADYVSKLSETRLDGLRIVLDCANGAASAYAEGIFAGLGASVKVIHNEPDGVNINAACGSTHPEIMQETVVKEKADFGLAFDGDADRCLACDENGRMIDGDHMLFMFAEWLRGRGRLYENRLVTTVMANLGLEIACRENGLNMARTAVGDRYVLEEMLKSGAVLGGEQSGHIIFSDYSTTGDGMVTGLVLAQIVKSSRRKLSELASKVEKKPQYLVNVKVKDKHTWNSYPEVAACLKKAEKVLEGRGRILVRPSGTENLIRVMAEGPDKEELETLINMIVGVLFVHCGEH
ncbi:phosphoglucosamine mutase [bacterium]|nr:phosphoglucosamine mutase [bacterium]